MMNLLLIMMIMICDVLFVAILDMPSLLFCFPTSNLQGDMMLPPVPYQLNWIALCNPSTDQSLVPDRQTQEYSKFVAIYLAPGYEIIAQKSHF